MLKHWYFQVRRLPASPTRPEARTKRKIDVFRWPKKSQEGNQSRRQIWIFPPKIARRSQRLWGFDRRRRSRLSGPGKRARPPRKTSSTKVNYNECVVPHYHHYTPKMAGLSMIIQYCTRSILPPCPSMGFGVVERHLEMAQPTKKPTSRQHFYSIRDQISVLDPVAHLFSNPDFFLLSQSVVFQENKVKCHRN